MQISIPFVVAALSMGAAVVEAHATVWGVWVNGAFQGDGRNQYIRSPPNNNPVKDVRTTAINCNVNNRVVPKTVSIKAGDTYTVEWYHDNRNDDIIAASHKGPHTFYIASASTNGNGAVWTKLCEDGLSGGRWAVDRIIANQGKISCAIPSWVAPGDYLIRAEIIALHEGETSYLANNARGAQFYPSCAQVKVTSGGSTQPGQNYNFVGGYTATTPGILFNVYNSPTSYPIPGPRPWSPGSGEEPAPDPEPQPTSSATSEPTQSPPPTSGSVQKWGQCGGINYNGPTSCSGSTCVKLNDYYYQCQ